MKKFIFILSIIYFNYVFADITNDKKIEKVGIVLASSGHVFLSTIAKGIKTKLKENNPKVSITTVASEYDLSKQASQIDTFISSGVQVIFINAADSVAIKPFIEKAKKQGIIVIAIDVIAQGASLTVMTDNIQAGEIACEDLAKRINQKGEIVIINGPPTSSFKDRFSGCLKSLNKYPEIKILSNNQDGKASREGGMKVMESLLTKFSKIDAVFSLNDPMTVGADLATKQFKRREMIISSVDALPELVDLMKKGDTNIVSSSAQDPFKIGELAAQNSIDLFNGKKINDDKILIKTKLISIDNLEDYVPWN